MHDEVILSPSVTQRLVALASVVGLVSCGSQSTRRVGAIEIVHETLPGCQHNPQREVHIYCNGEHVSPTFGPDRPGRHWLKEPSIGPNHVAFEDDVSQPSKLVLIDSTRCNRIEPLRRHRIMVDTVEWNARGDRLSVAFENASVDRDTVTGGVAIVSLEPSVSVQAFDGYVQALWDKNGDSALLVPGWDSESRRLAMWTSGMGFQLMENSLPSGEYRFTRFGSEASGPYVQFCANCEFGWEEARGPYIQSCGDCERQPLKPTVRPAP